MAKVTIKGEVFSFEPRFPIGDSIVVEKALGITFDAWKATFAAGGSAAAIAAFVWLVLRQNGRNEPALAQILSGDYELYPDQIEIEGDEPDPTEDGENASPRLSGNDGSGLEPSPTGSGTPQPSSTP